MPGAGRQEGSGGEQHPGQCHRPAALDARGRGKPIVVVADTVKGKGVSFMENDVLWHYRTARGEEYDAAVKELEAQKP